MTSNLISKVGFQNFQISYTAACNVLIDQISHNVIKLEKYDTYNKPIELNQVKTPNNYDEGIRDQQIRF